MNDYVAQVVTATITIIAIVAAIVVFILYYISRACLPDIGAGVGADVSATEDKEFEFAIVSTELVLS